MRFIGVDLAWGGRNPSGLAVLDEHGRVLAEDLATSDADIAAFVAGHDAGGSVLALDAPLVVGNPTGRRACEAELQHRYGRVGAGPYPSNLALLGGRVRAMELVQRLPMPYQTVPRDPRRGHGWWAVEVFPHPALVALGGLRRALRYKKGPVAARVAGLRRLHEVLAGLEAATPPLRLSPDGRLQGELSRLDSLRGRARKGFEDLADAHVCAYVGLWWWWHGRSSTLVAGDDEHGAILVPIRGARARPRPAHQGDHAQPSGGPPMNQVQDPLP
jgi:predicted RNase H-like nuclease